MTLRVLLVYRTFFPDTQGGAEETIRQIAVGLQKLGCEVRVFVPSRDPYPEQVDVSGITVIRKKMQFEIASCGFALGSVREFRSQVSWADVVHYHFPWPFGDLLDLVVGVDKPKVVTYHSDIVRQQGLMKLYQPLMNRFLSSVDSIVATSQQYVDSSQVLSSFSNVEVIPIGIDEKSFPVPSGQTVERVTDQYGTDYFFFIGVLRYYKGLHLLLEASQGGDFKVLIAGKGPEDQALKRQADELNLKNVEFLGAVSDEEKMVLIENCRAMVFPSHLRSEAFGVTLLEGLMQGKPLVCAEVGTGTSFVNQHEDTGLVVNANDASSLRAAMEQLLDDELVMKFGQRARKRFDEFFTADKMAHGYRNLYLRIVGNTH